jgi:hypothetical protein
MRQIRCLPVRRLRRSRRVKRVMLVDVSGILILNSAVAGLKMAHRLKITVAFEFAVLTLTAPGLKPPQISKSFVLSSICTIFILLDCRI